MSDRCPVCDRPPTTWKPEEPVRFPLVVDDRGFTNTCDICGEPTGWTWKAGMGHTAIRHTSCSDREAVVGRERRETRAAAAAADPSVCWGGAECAAHEVKWRRRALEAELRCERMERELCEARADLAGVRETLRVDRATTPDYWKRAYIAANGLACDFRKKLEKIDVAVQEVLAATKEHPPQTLFEALKWACAVMLSEDEAIMAADKQREAVKKRIVAALEGLRKVMEE